MDGKLIFPIFLSDYRIVEKRYDNLNDAAYSALKYRDCAVNFLFNRMRDLSFCRNWDMSRCRNFGAMFYNTFGMESVDFGN